jgi:DNA-binding NtrC family response regulator
VKDERSRVLLVEDDPHLAEQFRWGLKDNFALVCAADGPAAKDALRVESPDLVLLDLCLPPSNEPEEGFGVLAEANKLGIPVVVMSALEERTAALKAIDNGAYDFFAKPLDLAALRIVIGRALERQSLRQENRSLRRQLHETFQPGGIIGTSPPIMEVFESIRRVADSPVTVILQGESGTGKGLVARALHYNSLRSEGPFMAVHCAALPETLLEAELFGHVKGAFTGADCDRVGRFEAASGGTLFLDEISCLPPATQIKLLRVLEERSVERLGSNESRAFDVRLVVATNEDLEAKVERGEFREDFYFRIKVFPILLPPLRERGGDIALLADHFLSRICADRGLRTVRLTDAAREELARAPWPGNVRQLLNVVETMALLVQGEEIDRGDVRRAIPESDNGRSACADHSLTFKDAVASFERELLTDAIRKADGIKARAARRLGLDPSQMKYLSRKYQL